ncbi:hypothetical protein [Aquimarina addita]
MKNNLFKNLGKVAIVLSVFFIISCGSDDDGDDVTADVFVTLPTETVSTYTGSLGYTPADGMGVVGVTDGTATITQSGSSYTISFSDGVPSITGLRFLGSDGAYASVSSDGSSLGISLDDGELAIGATIDGNTWAFSGDR